MGERGLEGFEEKRRIPKVQNLYHACSAPSSATVEMERNHIQKMGIWNYASVLEQGSRGSKKKNSTKNLARTTSDSTYASDIIVGCGGDDGQLKERIWS